jgi:hypothetical protein
VPAPQSAPASSSLGRYTPTDGSPPVPVRLLNVPVQVMAAAREHHDELMREFRLIALSGRLGEDDAPPRLLEITHVLGETYAAAMPRGDDRFDAAAEQGEVGIDVEETVPASAGAAIASICALMDEVDVFCADELLMTMPRPPLLKRFADWYCAQYVTQVAGGRPQPWDGPMTPDS